MVSLRLQNITLDIGIHIETQLFIHTGYIAGTIPTLQF